MGVSHHAWGAVVPLLVERCTVVAYDRSGLGASPVDPAPRNLDRLVGDLGDVLDQCGDGPFVLVGHSWGGPIVRCAASRAPDRVAGIVLVDATDERCDLFFGAAAERQTAMAARVMPIAARLGLTRLAAKRFARHLPPRAALGMRAEDGTPAAVRVQIAELEFHVADLRRLRGAPPVLPDVPVSVITGTVNGWGERRRRPELVAAHRATAASIPQGRHVEATRSSHYVPLTEPQLVADEILRIVAST